MSELFTASIGELKGVGKAAAEAMAQLGIASLGDFVNTFPYRHDDARIKDLAETPHNEKVTVEGRVESEPSLFFMGKGRSRLEVRLLVGIHLIKAVFFNQAYVKQKLVRGETVTVGGKWDRGRQSISATYFRAGSHEGADDFEPVYSLKGLISQKKFRALMRQALDLCLPELPECLPEELRARYELPGVQEAYEGIHFPKSAEQAVDVRRRFAYEELLAFQLKVQYIKERRRSDAPGSALLYDNARLKRMIASLPFELTGAQKRSINEICRDLRSPARMNRLLQGDVGSGKTAVAAVCLYAAILAGFQGALMAPTEILAEQHAETLASMLGPHGVRVALLTGSTKQKARRELLARLAEGEIDLLIGTHALIQPGVEFCKLGLVITDEQHRFCVSQRRVLKEKGPEPDVLFMTATPIPRTLAITAFGEMDVSVLDEMPAGRKKIETHWMKRELLPKLLVRMERELAAGRQAYVICPLIEESDKLDFENAVEVHSMLSAYYGGRYRVGLMHGRMSSAEKEGTMRDFTEGRIDVLVSTTVVEVGVNVPNASFMIIYDAERFGLAQLHQLRGRIGRGEWQSYCVLLADPKSEEGKERMLSMAETDDGFALAEKDLQLRGAGDVFGRRQSGLPEFQFADLVHDSAMLETARLDAERLLGLPSFWSGAEYACLRAGLEALRELEGERID